MGIFKIFGKKVASTEKPSSDKTSSKKPREKGGNTVIGQLTEDGESAHAITEKKHNGRATERKIDAIEFEMSRDMVRPKTSKTTKSTTEVPLKRTEPNQFHTDFVATDFQTTETMPATDLLLGQHTDILTPVLSHSESVPLLEEAAILYASGQNKVAEHMLQSAIEADNLGNAIQAAWFMLFDLYQIEKNQYAFESLSLDYASKFEMSPPFWREINEHIGAIEEVPIEGAIPSVTFPAQLDGEIIKLLQKLQVLSEKSKSLKLDFSRVKAVGPVGCGLLLRTMKGLKKSKHDLVLISAENLTQKIRAILEVGRRDETEAPWLLLLEVLQLLQRKEEFEETGIDYCVTFEVSPPSFETPTNKISTSITDAIRAEELSAHFTMPKIIEGNIDHLISNITEYAKAHPIVMLDCSRLERVEFGASAQLLNSLVPISSGAGKAVEFQEVNHLILHLFNALGLKSVATITPRKHA